MRLATCLLLIILVPGASAQVGYELQVDAPDVGERIQPEVEEREVAVPWQIVCTTTAEPGTPTVNDANMSWQISPQALGIAVTGATEARVSLPDCGAETSTEGEQTFTIQATREAPGLEPVLIDFSATLTWQGPTTRTDEATMALPVEVSYIGALQARLASAIKEAGPGETSTYQIEVTNRGNAATHVLVVAASDRASVPERWPEAPLGVGETGLLEVTYRHPDGAGWNNEQSNFALNLTPVAALDENQRGDPVHVNALARTRGVPALGVPLIAAALGLMVIRRR